MKKFWKTLSKKKEYSNPFMEVWEHEIIRPNGEKGSYYVLERDIAGTYFSIAIPLTDEFDTFLVRQYRYPIGLYSWEFPMGHAKVRKEDFLEVAKIELKEETGIIAKTWKKIGRFFTAPGHSSEQAQVFVAMDLTVGKAKGLGTEILEVKKINILQVNEMIKKGKIIDGQTIVAYYYLELYLKGKNL